MTRRYLWAIVAAVALITGGCKTELSCTTVAVPSFQVHVVDAAGKSLCTASVTVRDGDFSEQLSGSSGYQGTSCSNGGVIERKGTYTIEVRNGAAQKTVDDVKVSADACHVHTKKLTIVLG